jgi:putative GTP pyrophosphokinase
MTLTDEFKKVRPRYEEFTILLEQLLTNILSVNRVDYHLLEKRTKTLKSFNKKISLRFQESITLSDITDICGLRIITYYKKDIDRISKLIEENFNIEWEKSSDKAKILKNNEFGYLSTHFIIKMNDERSMLPEWQNYSNLSAEIQIRTVLQHSWASISHKLHYKKDYEIPETLKRQLNRLAGIFELADDEFENIREKNNQLIRTIKNTKISKDIPIKQEINLITLRNFFNSKTSLCDQIDNIATDAGYKNILFTAELNDWFLSKIIKQTDLINIQSLNDFEYFLNNNLNILKSYLSAQKDSFPFTWNTNTIFTIYLFLLYFIDIKDLKTFLDNEWNSRSKEDIYNVIKTLKSY